MLAHRRALPLVPGEPARLDIEVLPSGTRFEAGEQLLLVVQGSDVMRYPEPPTYARHADTVNVAATSCTPAAASTRTWWSRCCRRAADGGPSGSGPQHDRTSWGAVVALVAAGVVGAAQIGKGAAALPVLQDEFGLSSAGAAWFLSS